MNEIEIEVQIEDVQIEAIVEVTVINSGGGTSTVENSNGSYSQEVDCGDTLVLPDNTFLVYVNGILNSTASAPVLEDTVINIGN